jgi:hypothetical protein
MGVAMPTCSEAPALVIFRHGFVADWTVVERLLDLEARGVTFTLADAGRFRVTPVTLLTEADRAFLRARRDEVRAVVAYYSHEVPA